MKQIKLASAIALAMGIAVVGSAQAASGGTITFTGSVTDATCTVSGGAGSDGGTGNFSVALDEVNANQLAAAGDTANKKAFSVIIGGPGQGTCTDGKVASMSFLPSSIHVDAATGALKNALTGEATNTQVQLLDGGAAGTPINLAAGTYAATATIANNTATIPFSVQYLAVNGAATPGLVSTNVVYAVTYN
ncbi:fimbrial protein [Dyella subtropica]|uniref:fimbrial protein n=1 Tax=Dyella subtropica TaxID=2992127 RepID=UPI00225BA85B|nr:fimbrial protein [Dyella subtropica]